MSTSRTQQRSQREQKSSTQRTKAERYDPESISVRQFIIRLLREKGSLTRGEITKRSGIPRTTVYDTLMSLFLAGTIDKYVERNGQRGRPSVYYQLAAE
jgi:predicted ArsR family transcriptional regulator